LCAAPAWAGASGAFPDGDVASAHDIGTGYDALQDGDFSVCYWAKIDVADGTAADRWTTFGRYNSSSIYEFYMRTLPSLSTYGRLQFNQGCVTQNGQQVYEWPSDVSGEWHFLCGIFDGATDTGDIWIDGIDVAHLSSQTCDDAGVSTSDSDICIGQTDQGDNCDGVPSDDEGGSLAYFQMWDRELPEAEIIQAMHCPGGVPENLFLYVPFQDTFSGAGATVLDISGSGFNGVEQGAITQSSDGPPVSNCAGSQ
jgi:hypothetical protein